MRIVLLNQYYAPDEAATAQLLADLGAGLARRGHDVLAIASRRGYGDPRLRHRPREIVAGVQVRRVGGTGFGRGRSVGRALDYATFLAGAALALARTPRPDAVLSLSTPPLVALLGLARARAAGARSVYWVMDVYPELAFRLGVLSRGSAAGRVLSALSRLALGASGVVVALGSTMAARLGESVARTIEVVPNWADGEAIRARPTAGHDLRAAWGWDGRFVVLYSGNFGLAHEFDTALDAAARLAARPDILFAFVGTGPRLDEIRDGVARRALANVAFRPPVPRAELGASLTAGDIHLVTLRPGLEGLLVPSKIYGILAAGRPTAYVGPDQGEIADLLRDGGCGERAAPGDAPALASIIARYADDGAWRAEQGRRARALFERCYTREQAIERFTALIERGA